MKKPTTSKRTRGRGISNDDQSGGTPRWLHWLLAVAALSLTAVLIHNFLRRPPDTDTGEQGTADVVVQWTADPLSDLPRATPEQSQIADLKQKAIQAATELVHRYPKQPFACHVLAKAYSDLGDSTKAIEWWHRSLELNPNFTLGLCQLAFAAKDRAQYNEAANWYEQALALDATLFEAQFGLAEAQVNLGNLETALELLRPEQRDSPAESGPSFLLAGQIHLELRQYEQARTYLERAIQFIPKAPAPYHSLAIACARLGDRDQATDYRKMFQQKTKSFVKARGDVKGVKADLASVRSIVAGILGRVGKAYARFGDPAETERLWSTASQIDRTDMASRQSLVLLYQRSGRVENAIEILQQLCQLQPENASYHFARGNALVATGQLNQAKAAFAQAIRLNPSNQRYQEQYEQLKAERRKVQ